MEFNYWIAFLTLLFPVSGVSQKVGVAGSLSISADSSINHTPAAGTLRWTGSDFQGWTGTGWVSLMAGAYVFDVDNNEYPVIKIGDQFWLGKNLMTTRYNDGSPIDLSTNAMEWNSNATEGSPSYCWFDDDEQTYKERYGALYNYYVVDSSSNGSRNVCPAGWRVPASDDLVQLQLYLGGENVSGGMMKEGGFASWNAPNNGANDASGFGAVAAGRRGPSGMFAGLMENCYLRSVTPGVHPNAIYGKLSFNNAAFEVSSWNKGIGMSVRCIKD